MTTLRKSFIAAAASLALGTVAFTASAAPPFVVNPVPFANGDTFASPFIADFVQGGSTARVVQVGATTNYTSSGWIQYTGFFNGPNPVGSAQSGLNFFPGVAGYGLYATFDQTFSCPAVLKPGVTCDVTGITLNLLLDPKQQDTFTQATLAANPTVTDVGADDILLATVNLVVEGTAGINSLGGAFENVNTNFLLTGPGGSYFVAPVPFYNLAFSEFNNTSVGLQCSPSGPCPGNGQVFAITSETGGTNFAINVPEPASLGLIGLGLFAAGVVRRRKQQ